MNETMRQSNILQIDKTFITNLNYFFDKIGNYRVIKLQMHVINDALLMVLKLPSII